MTASKVPFGTIEDGKIILNPWKDHPAKVVGEIREEGEEYAVNYFQERFAELAKKVEDLETTIEETENKGSYLQKVLHLKESLASYDGLGDFAALDDRLSQLQETLLELVAKNRIRNTEIKKTLIQELKESVEIIGWDESTEAVQDVKSRWIKVGNAVKEEQDRLNDEFWEEVQKFFDRKKAFFDDKRRLMKQNEQAYWDLVKEANTVARLAGPEKFKKIDELKARWREVGNIPSRMYKPLLTKFQNNLKGGNRFNSDPIKELERIQAELIAIQQGNSHLDPKKTEFLRKKLFNIRSRDPKIEQRKNEYLNQLQLLSEMSFVEHLCGKRFQEYHTVPEEEQRKFQVKILQELIGKEEEELEKFETNQDRFNRSDAGAERMIQRRLTQQRDRIDIKRRLISMLGG